MFDGAFAEAPLAGLLVAPGDAEDPPAVLGAPVFVPDDTVFESGVPPVALPPLVPATDESAEVVVPPPIFTLSATLVDDVVPTVGLVTGRVVTDGESCFAAGSFTGWMGAVGSVAGFVCTSAEAAGLAIGAAVLADAFAASVAVPVSVT